MYTCICKGLGMYTNVSIDAQTCMYVYIYKYIYIVRLRDDIMNINSSLNRQG
jgi:hypothetical protein